MKRINRIDNTKFPFRPAVHTPDPESDRRCRRDPTSEVSGGRISDRGDQVGEGESRVTGRHAAEGELGRHPDNQQRAKEGRRRRLHLLGEEQAGPQRQAFRRRRGDR